MLKVAIVASVLIGGAQVSRAETQGMIAAVVVDQRGNPVQGALVRADRMDEGLTVGVVPQCLTDKFGKCSCDHLALGEYTLNASKADAGYPPMYIPLYRHGQPPKKFWLTASHPIEEVSLTLGPKAGSIDMLVTDAATGKAVKSATVLLRRMANPNDFFLLK